MEPNKYDKDFRAKLNNREITPSADSWNKLDAMLNDMPEKKKKPMIWLYIAASVIGFLFVGNLFMMQGGESSTDTQIVNKDNPAVIAPLDIPQESISNNTEMVETQNQQEIIRENNSVKQEIAEVQPQNEILKGKESRNSIAKVVTPIDQKLTKVKEAVVVVHNPAVPQKTIKIIVNDDNLEKLLAEASSTQKTSPNIKINAKNLLSQVDTEIDHTFREKMIRSVTKNYQEIKVAVSNRNLESY